MAQLRKESGAAIGAHEFTDADLKFFPQPNDPPSVIKQKAESRRLAIKAMEGAGGAGFKIEGGTKEDATKPADVSAIPAGAVEKLKSNPDLRSAFDAKYGSGSAARVLGK